MNSKRIFIAVIAAISITVMPSNWYGGLIAIMFLIMALDAWLDPDLEKENRTVKADKKNEHRRIMTVRYLIMCFLFLLYQIYGEQNKWMFVGIFLLGALIYVVTKWMADKYRY